MDIETKCIFIHICSISGIVRFILSQGKIDADWLQSRDFWKLSTRLWPLWLFGEEVCWPTPCCCSCRGAKRRASFARLNTWNMVEQVCFSGVFYSLKPALYAVYWWCGWCYLCWMVGFWVSNSQAQRMSGIRKHQEASSRERYGWYESTAKWFQPLPKCQLFLAMRSCSQLGLAILGTLPFRFALCLEMGYWVSFTMKDSQKYYFWICHRDVAWHDVHTVGWSREESMNGI